jgi:hypothetical protein
MKRPFIHSACLLLLIAATGCFRAGSETRALRDAALKNGARGAEEKIEIGAGFFTVGIAHILANYVSLPPEAQTALSSIRGGDVSIYDVRQENREPGRTLAAADAAMEKEGCNRLVGVIHDGQLVAIYVPRNIKSAAYVRAHVIVLNNRQLVCASARADIRDLMEMAMSKAEERLSERPGLIARR